MIRNPILKGFNPDPSICRVDKDYYIAVSTFEWFPGVRIYHSTDLKHWQLVSTPLNRISQLNMLGNPDSGGVWAPDLSYCNGQFWLIYSDVKVVDGNSWKDVANYLVTCETIDGTWSEPIHLNNSGFDPSLFHDDDGKKYLVNMVWDYRASHHRFYGIVMQEYSHEKRRLTGKPEIIFKGTNLKLTEAPHLYRWNGYYYLLTAEGGTQYEHAATLARSKSIHGPYEVHPDNPLISSWSHPHIDLQKAGHGSIVHTHTDEWYFVHLTARPVRRENSSLLPDRGYCPLGRETAIQKLYWQNGWPYVEGGNFPKVDVPSPKMPEQTINSTPVQLYDFNEVCLNSDLQTLRIPFTNQIGSLEDRPGYLRLFGRESLKSLFYNALVARRWESLFFEATTCIEYQPDCFLQFAGLTNYYNSNNWSSLHVTFDEEKGKIIDILLSVDGQVTSPIKGQEIVVPPESDRVYLKAAVSGEVYWYAYSFDGKIWQKIAYLFDSLILSDDFVAKNYGGFFTGAFTGMFCVDLTGRRLEADFDFFEYKEKEENIK
ncbi:glycoside hydrolase family 43 protein [Vagococcus acidifermentans]|uniref:Glycoside hydrolase 43 family protein n=1 Tax=Vagococcus acidifermentans TaxID=564710 RepID=A0A430AXP3_9ENTE|nr:glycoside hydrolase family 43 protein [Vagococcus acidifermentans]RSU12837.1 glycoside hydrolase 43 family protein [Vagococcus acidifermentans]